MKHLLIIICIFALASCGVYSPFTYMVDVNSLSRHEFEFKSLQIEYPKSLTSQVPTDATSEIPLCERDNRLKFLSNGTYEFYDNSLALCASGNRANTVVRSGRYSLRNVNSHTDITMQQTFPTSKSPIVMSIAGLGVSEFKYTEPITNDGQLKVWIFKVVR